MRILTFLGVSHREDTGVDVPRREASTWKGGRSASRKSEPISNGTASGDDSGGSGKMSDGESDDKDMQDAAGNESAEKPATKGGKSQGGRGGFFHSKSFNH
jgi:hypothetical protein